MHFLSIVRIHSMLWRWFGNQESQNSNEITKNMNSIEEKSTSRSINRVSSTLIPSAATECYACTQIGVPAFHSTSCDRTGTPEWSALAGTSLYLSRTNSSKFNGQARTGIGMFGSVLDPRSERVRKWNRVILLARALALAVDPVFFYTFSIGRGGSCLYMDGVLALVVSVLRTCVDFVHLWHVWLQFRLAYVSRETLVIGCGKLVWDARAIALHYMRCLKGFWLDVFVILPIPQVIYWSLVPILLQKDKITFLMGIVMLIFLFQYLPKVYHTISLMRRMQKVTGYVFGTIWWGFGLNVIAYLIASHAFGGVWYVLGIQRVASCLAQQCTNKNCNVALSCTAGLCDQLFQQADTIDMCATNSTITRSSSCLDENGAFSYGIYSLALPAFSSNGIIIKILYPISWGLFQLSSFGNNLSPTSQSLEVMFCMSLVLGGLLLFTSLVGNIQVFLQNVMAKKTTMEFRCQDMKWWMRRRQFPSRLRRRVLHFERQNWTTNGGVEELDIIQELPEGLRRDIKRYLCIDLLKKVPLLDCLEDIILDNICDRLKPLIYCKDEKILREGDPVKRMMFIARGRIKSSQQLSRGMVATDVLEPGAFLGDELLSWCLRRPFNHRLPSSSATFVCLEPTEAFGLDAYDLRYITEHFRYKFANKALKQTLRYLSSNWRTWAAVNIQFAWRRYVKRTKGSVTYVTSKNSDCETRLLQVAAMFLSFRPHDHLD